MQLRPNGLPLGEGGEGLPTKRDVLGLLRRLFE